MTTTDQELLQFPLGPIPNEFLNLLEAFNDVFQTLIRLPPSHLQDHRISLCDESVVVKMRPYCYLVI